ncbi:hypothetical protein BDD12DRAFT_893883 [Trichophaea hybrida]|nr:hypothetical protein BDD12DRAFT_893883 [Trichophaea hybrida]
MALRFAEQQPPMGNLSNILKITYARIISIGNSHPLDADRLTNVVSGPPYPRLLENHSHNAVFVGIGQQNTTTARTDRQWPIGKSTERIIADFDMCILLVFDVLGRTPYLHNLAAGVDVIEKDGIARCNSSEFGLWSVVYRKRSVSVTMSIFGPPPIFRLPSSNGAQYALCLGSVNRKSRATTG